MLVLMPLAYPFLLRQTMLKVLHGIVPTTLRTGRNRWLHQVRSILEDRFPNAETNHYDGYHPGRNLDLDMTAEQLKGSVSINNPTDTRILEITVNNTDSKMAKKIVDEIANVSSSYIGDKMEVIPPKIIEVGKIATVRTSPSVKKNAALGFLLGFLACAAIVVVYAVMDDTIKTEEDIEKYLGVSVLAKVPDRKDFINSKNRKSKNKNKKHH